MKILLKVRNSVQRSIRIFKVVRWKRRKARMAYEAWINEEYVHVGQGAFNS